MGFTSRISRVQVFVVWKSSCRLKVGCRRCIYAIRSHRWSVIIGFTYILDTSFYVQYHLLLLLSRNPPLSNFRIVSEQGRTKDLKTQNWQLYKSPERASAVSTNIWGDQPSRRSGLGFIVFGSEAWVPVTSLCVWKSISCLLSLIPKICLSFSCSSSVQHWESLGLFGLIVHSTARLPIYSRAQTKGERDKKRKKGGCTMTAPPLGQALRGHEKEGKTCVYM